MLCKYAVLPPSTLSPPHPTLGFSTEVRRQGRPIFTRTISLLFNRPFFRGDSGGTVIFKKILGERGIPHRGPPIGKALDPPILSRGVSPERIQARMTWMKFMIFPKIRNICITFNVFIILRFYLTPGIAAGQGRHKIHFFSGLCDFCGLLRPIYRFGVSKPQCFP